MTRPLATVVLVLAGASLAWGTASGQPRYNYGGRSYAGGEGGFVVSLEAGLANPRDTDNVVAAAGPNVVIPQWDDELAGRLGVGYIFGNGSTLGLAVWGYTTDQSEAGVGAFEFPIGPTDGFSFDVKTEIKARTVDVSWAVPHEVADAFEMEWSVGLRYAGFEETTDGMYGTTGGPRVAAKSNQGDMLGARIGGRGRYRVGSFSLGAGLGLSLLDGEIEASSSLTPQPAGTSPLVLTDDSRSGSILDVDVRAAWHGVGDALSLWVGWEQQKWQDIAADLARNLPGSSLISRDRDSVTFSWVKAGVSYRF
jgi:hypothetical protein